MKNTNAISVDQDPCELMLSALRGAILRAKLDANQLATIGIALLEGWISPEGAVEWLHDIGLVDQVITDKVKT